MFPPSFSDEHDSENADIITLSDEKGRTLECFVERSLEVDGQEYFLVLPVDSPIEIFTCKSDDEEDIFVDDDATIDNIFSTAQAVLAEHNLVLKHTAHALTVAGELPPYDDSELFTLKIEDEESDLEEQLQLLANFFHEGQEYAIYTPIDPPLFFVRIGQNGKPHLLSLEESREVQPRLEEVLFDEIEEN